VREVNDNGVYEAKYHVNTTHYSNFLLHRPWSNTVTHAPLWSTTYSP